MSIETLKEPIWFAIYREIPTRRGVFHRLLRTERATRSFILRRLADFSGCDLTKGDGRNSAFERQRRETSGAREDRQVEGGERCDDDGHDVNARQ